jgi:hypothetical protein
MFPVAFANQCPRADSRVARLKSSPRRPQSRAREIVRAPAALRTNKAPDRPTINILSDRRDDPGRQTNDRNADRVSASPAQSGPDRRSLCACRYGPSRARRDIPTVSRSRPQRLQGRRDQCRWGVRANANASFVQFHHDDARLTSARRWRRRGGRRAGLNDDGSELYSLRPFSRGEPPFVDQARANVLAPGDLRHHCPWRLNRRQYPSPILRTPTPPSLRP